MIVNLILSQAPEDDLILGGFSQGAAMTLEVMQHPSLRDFVKGLILISGKVLRYQNVAEHLRNHPIPAVWMHGERDEMVPMYQGIEVYEVLNEAGCPVLDLRHKKGHMVDLSQKEKLVDWVSSTVL
jgi:predicted esterase